MPPFLKIVSFGDNICVITSVVSIVSCQTDTKVTYVEPRFDIIPSYRRLSNLAKFVVNIKNPQRSREWHSLDASAQPCQNNLIQQNPTYVKLGLAQQIILSPVIFLLLLLHLSSLSILCCLCICNAASDSLMVRTLNPYPVTM